MSTAFTPEQLDILARIGCGIPWRLSAAAAGIDARTVRAWGEDPEFLAAVDHARKAHKAAMLHRIEAAALAGDRGAARAARWLRRRGINL
jgi:hypothetical protein